jgi:Ca2+-binding RTX toxin-like protein
MKRLYLLAVAALALAVTPAAVQARNGADDPAGHDQGGECIHSGSAMASHDSQGSSGSDNLSGGSSNDAFEGLAGDDHIDGHGGNDAICGGAGDDHLNGGAGNDVLRGEAGDDSLSGGPGNDVLTGGSGRDSLRGGSDRDRIRARDGRRDRVTCGTGNDTVIADRSDSVSRDCEHVARS